MLTLPPSSPLFPYTTLFRSSQRVQNFTFGDAYTFSANLVNAAHLTILRRRNDRGYNLSDINANDLGVTIFQAVKPGLQLTDRKSTRLNSSHMSISYAVFCLK